MQPIPVESLIGAFLLAFPALFSIINPPGGALIFHDAMRGRSDAEQKAIAARIGLYSAIVLLVSLWLGGYILNFFGVSLSALRIAGGLVVAARAWSMLMQPEVHEVRKATSAEPAQSALPADDVSFFPLTMPLTTGPGTIAVAIALSSQRPATGAMSFFAGVSLAAISIAVVIWLSYRWSSVISVLLGRSGARVMSRLVAFLLLCVGVQIVVTGVMGLPDLLAARAH